MVGDCSEGVVASVLDQNPITRAGAKLLGKRQESIVEWPNCESLSNRRDAEVELRRSLLGLPKCWKDRGG